MVFFESRELKAGERLRRYRHTHHTRAGRPYCSSWCSRNQQCVYVTTLFWMRMSSVVN
ncbi:hypothetical protein DPMN_052540 [Dreissena polymorpha]|uniref:Uncharacterized protein n=1 Tax=Dreissena polymorpha TaxID=45954 RepID=A0A9D4HPX0_DREPO|nr:hypothetical protein DPMN_052540 [Dreissena polymorpha]